MTIRTVGQFEIRRVLGEGGIGRVYEALDQDLGRMVALKALKPEVSHDAGFVERFRAEASSLARLHHPNITTLYTMHRDGRDLYMVMELVGGRTLEDALEQLRRLDTPEVLAVAAQAAAGLGYAHRMGVIHRDIKPSNLMLTDAGELKIMDFGIARLRGSRRMTRAGNIIGTLAYMPPEQIKGDDNDERSDIYSLACVLYELLCGQPPFNAPTEYDLIRAQVEAEPPPLRPHCPTIEPAMEEVLRRALAKSPADRYPTAAAFAVALGANSIADPAATLRERIVGRLAAVPVKVTRAVGTGPTPQAPPAKTSIRKAPPAASAPAFATPRRGPPVAALALGGAAIVVIGVGAFVFLGGGSEVPPVPAPIPPPPTQVVTQNPPPTPTPYRSSTIQPPPDAMASLEHDLPALDMAECPPADTGQASAVIAGRVDRLSPAGWPVIGGQEIKLFGIETLGRDRQDEFFRFASKSDMTCCPVAGQGYRCVSGSGADVSQTLLKSGYVKAATDAPARYRAREDKARQARLGIWQ